MKTFKLIVGISLLASLGLYGFSFLEMDALPERDLILEDLYEPPIQGELRDPKPIRKEKEGFIYLIDPIYSYEISGLVVADYNSENWLDIFHSKDPLNSKDVCVAWGSNLSSGAYQKTKFSHGEFTCFWQVQEQDVVFNNNEISNNHLLPANEEINGKIKESRVGDQIYIRGYLANYNITATDLNVSRNTSISRNDTGNGACEVIYVTDFQILKRTNNVYHSIHLFTGYLSIFLFFLYIIVYFIYLDITPVIRKRTVVKQIDIDEMIKGKSFPSEFN